MFRKLTDVSNDSWTITESGSGTQLALQDELGGVAKFVNGSSDNNFQSYRSKAELLVIPGSGVVSFRTKVRIKDVSQCDMFVGYCENVTGKDIFDNRQNSVGWYLEDGGGGRLKVETNIGGDAAISTPTTDRDSLPIGVLLDETWVELALSIQIDPRWSRTAVNFFKNGQFMATHTTKMPTAAMAFYFALRNGEAAANEMSITTSLQLNS
jgi:hypothetical protein